MPIWAVQIRMNGNELGTIGQERGAAERDRHGERVARVIDGGADPHVERVPGHGHIGHEEEQQKTPQRAAEVKKQRHADGEEYESFETEESRRLLEHHRSNIADQNNCDEHYATRLRVTGFMLR